MADVRYDPTDPAFLDDPYPTYAALRERSPVHHERGPGGVGVWVVSRDEHVRGALRDWERFSSSPVGDTGVEGYRFLIGADPPDHTTLRRLVNRPFQPSAIAAMAPRVRALCEGLVDDLVGAAAAGRPVDLVEGLALPLPVIVIAEMLGIPSERRADFKRWSDAMLGGLSPDVDRAAMGAATMEMFAFFDEVSGQRRTDPGDDLISLLVGGPEPLTREEVLMFCMLLLVAGNETTTNLLSNLAAAAFAHPGTFDRLRAEPALVPAAVEEALRYDAPVQALWRKATVDVDLVADGTVTTVPAGDLVVVLYGSANRDERRFGDADRFDLGRYARRSGPADHLAFGTGIHLCLGAALARLEACTAVEVLLERTRDLAPAGRPTRVRNQIVRGLSALPVRLTPA